MNESLAILGALASELICVQQIVQPLIMGLANAIFFWLLSVFQHQHHQNSLQPH